jgi:YidC/Oxa1 family membrane protein insertase
MLIAANILGPLITVFEEVIKFFHGGIGGSWGWSIILLTVAIRVVLLPLTIKQFHSMQKLQRLTPEIKRLQAKYKQDKQRQQQEMMKLYQEHGVNPFSSCLPFVVQIPVLYALYFMLRSSLRADICPHIQPHHIVNGHSVINTSALQPCGAGHGANFLFIPDLTNHATGAVLVVLIVLYVVTQMGSSFLMSSPTMDKRQRQMMLLLPLVFVFIIIGLPSGVIVYWITTNALMLAQQYGVKRILGPVAPLPAVGGDGAGAAKDGAGAKTPAWKRNDAAVREEKAVPSTGGNGAGGGLAGLFRGRAKTEQEQPVGAGVRPRSSGSGQGKASGQTHGSGQSRGAGQGGPSGQGRSAPPPRPPRKKKKRSGRRR